MRVLLRNTDTGLYYAGPGQWSERTWDAFDFERVERAAQIYALEDVAYAQIVLEPALSSEAPRFSIPILKAA